MCLVDVGGRYKNKDGKLFTIVAHLHDGSPFRFVAVADRLPGQLDGEAYCVNGQCQTCYSCEPEFVRKICFNSIKEMNQIKDY